MRYLRQQLCYMLTEHRSSASEMAAMWGWIVEFVLY